jgi:hypothetical protein
MMREDQDGAKSRTIEKDCKARTTAGTSHEEVLN